MNRFFKRMAQVSSALMVSLLGMASANAAAVTFSLTGGTDSNPEMTGNTLTYTDPATLYTITVTSWADVGAGTLEAAVGYDTSGSGIGVCNSAEGVDADFSKCTSKNNRRSLDNTGEQEWLLIQFTEGVRLTDFLVSPDGNQGRDVTYFTGFLADGFDLTGLSYADLTGTYGMTQYNVNNGKSTADASIDIVAQAGGGDVWANSILIGGSLINGGDRIYLNSLATVVPLPAGVWLMLSALAALGARARLKKV